MSLSTKNLADFAVWFRIQIWISSNIPTLIKFLGITRILLLTMRWKVLDCTTNNFKLKLNFFYTDLFLTVCLETQSILSLLRSEEMCFSSLIILLVENLPGLRFMLPKDGFYQSLKRSTVCVGIGWGGKGILLSFLLAHFEITHNSVWNQLPSTLAKTFFLHKYKQARHLEPCSKVKFICDSMIWHASSSSISNVKQDVSLLSVVEIEKEAACSSGWGKIQKLHQEGGHNH